MARILSCGTAPPARSCFQKIRPEEVGRGGVAGTQNQQPAMGRL